MALFIDHHDAITVAIKRDAYIGFDRRHRFL